MRKLALLTCIAVALSVVETLTKLFAATLHLQAGDIWTDVSIVSAAVLASVLAGIELLFYFALYRDRGTLYVSTTLRLLCRSAALFLGIIAAADLPKRLSVLAVDWTGVMNLDWRSGGGAISTIVRDPASLALVDNLLPPLLNVLSIALLLVISRVSENPAEAVPVGRLLRKLSALAVISLGLVLLGHVVGLVMAPYSYTLIRGFYQRAGRMPPRPVDFQIPLIRGVALAACAVLVPFVVYRSSVKPAVSI